MIKSNRDIDHYSLSAWFKPGIHQSTFNGEPVMIQASIFLIYTKGYSRKNYLGGGGGGGGGRRQMIYFSMGGWCVHFSNYMGHWCLKNPDYMGGGQGFRFFSRLVGRSDPWSKKWWAIF